MSMYTPTSLEPIGTPPELIAKNQSPGTMSLTHTQSPLPSPVWSPSGYVTPHKQDSRRHGPNWPGCHDYERLCLGASHNMVGDPWCDVPQWAVVVDQKNFCFDARELMQMATRTGDDNVPILQHPYTRESFSDDFMSRVAYRVHQFGALNHEDAMSAMVNLASSHPHTSQSIGAMTGVYEKTRQQLLNRLEVTRKVILSHLQSDEGPFFNIAMVRQLLKPEDFFHVHVFVIKTEYLDHSLLQYVQPFVRTLAIHLVGHGNFMALAELSTRGINPEILKLYNVYSEHTPILTLPDVVYPHKLFLTGFRLSKLDTSAKLLVLADCEFMPEFFTNLHVTPSLILVISLMILRAGDAILMYKLPIDAVILHEVKIDKPVHITKANIPFVKTAGFVDRAPKNLTFEESGIIERNIISKNNYFNLLEMTL